MSDPCINLHPGGVNLRYLQIRILNLTEFMVWNIKNLNDISLQIYRLKTKLEARTQFHYLQKYQNCQAANTEFSAC